MSEGLALQVAQKTDELVDWVETDVIAQNQHPLGWEIWYEGADGEPATPEPVLFEAQGLREAWAMAMEQQRKELGE